MKFETHVASWVWDMMDRSSRGFYGVQSPTGEREDLYPEVTGYLIPTMMNRKGSLGLAFHAAEWLVRTQQADGSWLSPDGEARGFDTAMALSGLWAIVTNPRIEASEPYASEVKEMWAAIYLGKQWMSELSTYECQQPYFERVRWIMQHIPAYSGDLREPYTLQPPLLSIDNHGWCEGWGQSHRSHYMAYTLRGIYEQGGDITPALLLACQICDAGMPVHIGEGWLAGTHARDFCATAQFAILFAKNGMVDDAIACVGYLDYALERTWRRYDPHSRCPSARCPEKVHVDINKQMQDRCVLWGAKFYLDACAAIREHSPTEEEKES